MKPTVINILFAAILFFGKFSELISKDKSLSADKSNISEQSPINQIIGNKKSNQKILIYSAIILATASLFVELNIAHPFWMIAFLVLTCIAFSLFGFIIGLWADNFEKLQIIPTLIITPLVFLGGSFYSISMLPPLWQKITLFNPVLYLVSGFRWSFFEVSDVSVGTSLLMILLFLSACIALIAWMFQTGYKLKQ